MSVLILCVGLPRSGKTTWSRQQGFPIVSPDAIRLALHGQRFEPQAERFVWAIARCMVESLFLAGHEVVILDATNLIAKYRDEWKDSKWAIRYKVFQTSKETCIERAKALNDDYILPVIERMAGRIDPLTAEEVNSLWRDRR